MVVGARNPEGVSCAQRISCHSPFSFPVFTISPFSFLFPTRFPFPCVPNTRILYNGSNCSKWCMIYCI
jgi:hypothetical protein